MGGQTRTAGGGPKKKGWLLNKILKDPLEHNFCNFKEASLRYEEASLIECIRLPTESVILASGQILS